MIVPLDKRPRSGPYSGINARSAKRFLTRQFAEAGLPFAEDDALDLVLGLCGLSRTDYAIHGTDFIQTDQFDALRAAADRRIAGEPVDRILGWREFYGRRFAIDNVLSPRGDTEVLLLAAQAALRGIDTPRVADLGTGSGALAISLLCERGDLTAIATDRDAAALITATANANALNVSDRVEFRQSDWFADLTGEVFDVIVSNPPYITTDAMGALEREVADHDPDGALHGGRDGLDPYRVIVPDAREHLRPGGWLGVEIGFDQGDAVRTLFEIHEYEVIRIRQDPAGMDRTVEGRRAG